MNNKQPEDIPWSSSEQPDKLEPLLMNALDPNETVTLVSREGTEFKLKAYLLKHSSVLARLVSSPKCKPPFDR